MLYPTPEHYSELFDAKVQQISAQLSRFNPPSPEVFPSPSLGFRLRVEFRIWHQDRESFYAMFDPETRQPIRVDEFKAASPDVQKAMPLLLEQINTQDWLRTKLYQVEFLNTLSGELLITLIYHKALDEHWINKAKTLEPLLKTHIIGRSRRQKCIISQDFLIENLLVKGRRYLYRQSEGSFTQPNGIINQAMLSWTKDQCQTPERDLLEMYCGNGNFSIALASEFRQVLATEVSKASILAARHNVSLNHINNLEFVKMSAEEISQSLNGSRAFRRLPPEKISSYNFSTVLVDPPRAGLDSQACALISAYEQILYVSCNPKTLAINLKQLCLSHSIRACAVFDQFPYTPHMECAVFLKSKSLN